MGQPDIHINIQQTLLASESLEASAKKIEGRVREFSDTLRRHMEGDHWSGGMKNAATGRLGDLVQAFDQLTDKCHRTGNVIRRIAEHIDETERANTSRFVDMGETR
jgi:hypothetical protein